MRESAASEYCGLFNGGKPNLHKRRREVIADNLAAEKLAGNEAKQNCERAALAELDALERFVCERLCPPV